MHGDQLRISRTASLQAQGITHVDDTLTSRYPVVWIRISRDSLKATLMPGSLFTGRPFFPKI